MAHVACQQGLGVNFWLIIATASIEIYYKFYNNVGSASELVQGNQKGVNWKHQIDDLVRIVMENNNDRLGL